MENNSMILGSIPGTCAGMHKTYEESMISVIKDASIIGKIESGSRIDNVFFYNKNDGHLAFNKINNDKYAKAVILNIMPVVDYHANGYYRRVYMVEYIDRSILHRHLVEERMLAEKQLNKEGEMSL